MLLPYEQFTYKDLMIPAEEHHSTFTGSIEHSILVKEHRRLGIMQLGFRINS
jgi:hypothetical protein